MKRILLSSFVVLSFATYVLFQRQIFPPQNISNPSTILVSPPPILPDIVQPSDLYRNGQYTGLVADAFYGNVQVLVTINAGRINNIHFLQYPNDHGNSIRISNYATPILAQEAIVSQSADVDIVSGATATSHAFIESLQSALNQAKI